MPLLQLILTIPGAAIIWAIGKYVCNAKYAPWEIAGPVLSAFTYFACYLILGGDNKSSINGLDEPFTATVVYLISFLARSVNPARTRLFSRTMAISVFVLTIATGVVIFLTTGPRHL